MSSSEWQRPETDPFARVWAEVKRVRRDAEQRVNYLLRNAGLRVAEGALHVLQRLVVEGDQEVTGSLDVTGDAEFTGDTSIGGTLGVTGETTLGGDTTISGDTDVTGRLGVTGQTTLGGDTTITGDTDVTGDLDVEGRAGFTGDTTIGGNLSVTGTLSLPSGIIDNDALTSPVTFRSGFANVDPAPVTVSTTETTIAQFTMQPPAGFTQALILVFGQIGAINTYSGLSAIACRVYIDDSTGPRSWGARRWVSTDYDGDVATFSTVFQAFDSSFPLPTSGVLTFRLVAAADHTWSNAVEGTVEAFAIFTR